MNAPQSWADLQARIARSITRSLPEGTSFEPTFERPPRPELGELALGCFPLARALRKGPPVIARELAQALSADAELGDLIQKVEPAGPYLNITLAPGALFGCLDAAIRATDSVFGRCHHGSGERVLVEFSSPNTNKPLHLGHVRNNVLGWSVATLLDAVGYDVIRANLINDRGIHICKSMLAYSLFGEGTDPERAGLKGDHLVGLYYVRYARELARQIEALREELGPTLGLSGEALEEELKRRAPLELAAQEMLRQWEAGDPDVRALWAKMNSWAIDGLQQTYKRMGITFDRYYFESQTWQRGKALVLEGLERGLCFRKDDGSVWVDLGDEGLESKLLLRRDGTTVYMTQDIGTTVIKQEETGFSRSMFVVADEQDRHFQVLFAVLKKLGYPWASRLMHLSYGMVNLPEGKMKSREGTVVDADDLMDELEQACLEKARESSAQGSLALSEEQMATMARQVSQAALKFYILKVSPRKAMIFNPQESISLSGDTGPYVQYAHARIRSLMARGREQGLLTEEAGARGALGRLGAVEERALALLLLAFPSEVLTAAERLSPSNVATYLLDVAGAFSRFYHDHPVLKADPELALGRLALCEATAVVLKEGLRLLGVDAPEAM